ncbi:lysophosphatidic acid receptor 3 isoform X2 [Macaca nemestrina]|uniref:lysophosphatidic acid receptor 3 isoform X2 n=1 Tax=Macaca nemestrina TaxID=9545 RepID=UPI0039B90FD4
MNERMDGGQRVTGRHVGTQLSLLHKGLKPEWEGLHLTQYFLFVRSPGKHNFSVTSLLLCRIQREQRLQDICFTLHLSLLKDVHFFSTMNECHYDKHMDFFYNRSNTDTVDDWTGTKLVIVLCVGSFFCLFIFFSNSLVIAAVIKNRKFHFPFYYLLANLAAADFFAGIAYVFLMFNTGPVSKTLTVNRWFLRQGLLDTSLTASLTNLLVIAVERHVSIMRMRVHSNLTKKRVTLLILLVWAIAIFMGSVPTLGWNCLCNISACSSLAPIYSRSYLVFWTVSNLMAFFIMVVVYLRIYMYVKRKTNVLSPHTSGSISRRRTPVKLMKTVMTVLVFMTTLREVLLLPDEETEARKGSMSWLRLVAELRFQPQEIGSILYSSESVNSLLEVRDWNDVDPSHEIYNLYLPLFL